MAHRALISVFDKNNVLDLARALHSAEWEILSTGGTAKYLTENGLPVTDVSAVTGFPECLDGRVKTLHPKIHAGILARRNDETHMKTLADLHVGPIDLVCVNLYPFFDKVQAGLSFEETIEFIDIGGPTMLRSAAKNFQDVIVLTDPTDYQTVIEGLKTDVKSGAPCVSTKFKRQLAAKVFNLTGAYDAAVSRFMFSDFDAGIKDFPAFYTVPLKKEAELRYGENAHQKAALYLTADRKGAADGMKQLQGKELSYNNIRDLDVAWKAVSAWTSLQKPNGVFTIALKHNSPCGAAIGKTLLESYTKTFLCDSVSIFGGIVGCSIPVDGNTAEEMVKTFLEVVIAPGFDQQALAVFSKKKNLRIIQADIAANDDFEFMSVAGGVLVQSRDTVLFEKNNVVTEHKPTQAQLDEMELGMLVAMFAKSNAIVVVKNQTAIGIGAGQTNRIWAAEQALSRAKAITDSGVFGSAEPAEVLVSDAFFPFSDCVEKAAEYGIKSIIQPGGSLRDTDSIDACNKLNISMLFTGVRHFKH